MTTCDYCGENHPRPECERLTLDNHGCRCKRLETEVEQLTIAITAALAEIKRNEGTPRVGLRGIERILSHALEGGDDDENFQSR